MDAIHQPVIHIGSNIIILNAKDEILLGKRKHIYGDGSWGLPGGHVEFGEGLDEAVLRELYEETGIHLNRSQVEFVGISNQVQELETDKEQHYLQVCFMSHTEVVPENKEPDICDGWQWFSLDNLPQPLFKPHVSLIEKLHSRQLYHEDII